MVLVKHKESIECGDGLWSSLAAVEHLSVDKHANYMLEALEEMEATETLADVDAINMGIASAVVRRLKSRLM